MVMFGGIGIEIGNLGSYQHRHGSRAPLRATSGERAVTHTKAVRVLYVAKAERGSSPF
jgi:hypothetical protein